MGFFGPPNVKDMEAKRDVKGLITVLMGKNGLERERAAKALGKIGEPSVESLLKVLKDIDEDTRYWAAIALGYTGDASVVEPLIEVLKEEDWFVRAGAVGALGSIGDVRAVEPLIQALKDEKWSVRMRAAEALGKIGDEVATPALTIALTDSEPDVCEASAKALVKIGTDEEATGDAVKVRCVRCGALETKSKLTNIAGHGLICEKCDKELTQEILKDMGRL